MTSRYTLREALITKIRSTLNENPATREWKVSAKRLGGDAPPESGNVVLIGIGNSSFSDEGDASDNQIARRPLHTEVTHNFDAVLVGTEAGTANATTIQGIESVAAIVMAAIYETGSQDAKADVRRRFLVGGFSSPYLSTESSQALAINFEISYTETVERGRLV